MRGELAAFASIENATVPLPLPLTPDVIVSQASLLVAVQLQPAAVVMLLLVELAVAAGLRDVGDTLKVQGGGAPAWVTETVCPAIVSVPVRGEVPGLAAIEKATAPVPLPLAPELTVSQAVLLVAVHVQPVEVVTVALVELAADPGLNEAGETVNEQGAAACVTVTVWPAIVRVPVRGDVAVLAAIEKATLPLPVPLAPDVMVSQASLLDDVQLQPDAVVTLALLELAAAPDVCAVGDTVNVQGADPPD